MIKLLAINGKMASGKTTIAEGLRDHQDFVVLSIASTIKKASTLVIEDMSSLYNYLKEMIENRSDLETVFFNIASTFDHEFAAAVWEKDETGAYIKTQWYRKLTQMVATKMREQFGADVWVKFCIKEALALHAKSACVVVDDLRLPEEKKLFEEGRFKILRLEVTPAVQKQRLLKMYGEINEEQMNHVTETALDNALFDFVIDTSNLDSDAARRQVYAYIGS